eukprot:Phypoly_transcript_13219.p1 GENE.Phypoly_transcript_13219~~Phypoly_transcript_13219.p1  ORF type:complete len:269 (+),score=24.35 Phypoly_transcript_13219:188-994(+)
MIGPSGNDELVSINNATGSLTVIASDSSGPMLYSATSCFDQTNKVFYYATLSALYPVDVEKKKELPLLKYDPGLGFSCFVNNSHVLVGLRNAQTNYYMQLVAFPLAPSNDPPKIVADLSAYNITISYAQAYDPIHNVFYSLSSAGNQIFLKTLNLNNPSEAKQTIFPCLPGASYLQYDILQNKLVGLTANFTDSGESEFYAFVYDDDGSCTLSVQLNGLFEPSAITYDPYSATFYIGDVGVLFMFETKTSKLTSVKIDAILEDIEVAY